MQEFAQDMRSLRDAATLQGQFTDAPAERRQKAAVQFIVRKARDMANFLQTYLIEDALYLHHSKRTVLQSVLGELVHLANSARYYEQYSQFDMVALSAIVARIQQLLDGYCRLGGSVYLFRHCDKAKRMSGSGRAYDGIAPVAVQKQARAAALEIQREIQLSPRPVRLVLSDSGMDRTRIFASIIAREALQVNQASEGKVVVQGPQSDSRILFSLFSKEALEEITPVLSKGEFYCFKNWMEGTNEYAAMKHQPKPGFVVHSVEDFLRSAHAMVYDQSHYTIVVGISHSFIIDALLVHKIPGLIRDVPRVIATAAFCKAECGEFNYLGKWVGL